MQNVHTKQIKKVNPLQCSRCQDEFPDQDELNSHQLNIDCAIRCPDCANEFSSKAQRQEHQKENHLEDANNPLLRELDESMWKQIKDNLNVYTTSLKNKKGGPSGIPNPERERWVLENIPHYENGRSSKLKANSKLELGQGYTIFTTLAPNMKILEHPCKWIPNFPIFNTEHTLSLRLRNSPLRLRPGKDIVHPRHNDKRQSRSPRIAPGRLRLATAMVPRSVAR
jgi:uncharacterized Zn ribbon protein